MKLRTLMLMLGAVVSATAFAIEIEGVKLADTATVAGRDLVLNGAGLRTKLVFDVYVASLYLPTKVSEAALALRVEPRRVRIDMLRAVGAEDFLATMNDGIEANASEADLQAIQPQLGEFSKVITAIGETKKGDAITLDFVEGNTVLGFNGSEKAKIAGADFNRALLNVWLGDHPVQADLKKALLGG